METKFVAGPPKSDIRGQVNEAIRALVAKHGPSGKILLLDLDRKMPFYGLPPDQQAARFCDGLHLSSSAYGEVAGMLAELLLDHVVPR